MKKTRKVPRNQEITVGKFFSPDETDDTIEEYEELLLIDKESLDTALEQQPDLLFRVGEVLALQISRRDAAKQYLANQEAVVDQLLRRAGKVHDSGERMTDKAIEAQKRVHSKVVSATDQLLRMEYSVRRWNNLKESVVQRGHALRELVNLRVENYYAAGGSVTVNKLRDVDAATARKQMSRMRRGLD